MEVIGFYILIGGAAIIFAVTQTLMVVIGFKQKPWQSIFAAGVIGTTTQLIAIALSAAIANYNVFGFSNTSQVFMPCSLVLGSFVGSVASAYFLRIAIAAKSLKILILGAVGSLSFLALSWDSRIPILLFSFQIIATILGFVVVERVKSWQIVCSVTIGMVAIFIQVAWAYGNADFANRERELESAAEKAKQPIEDSLKQVFDGPITIRWSTTYHDPQLYSFINYGRATIAEHRATINAHGVIEGVESIHVVLVADSLAPKLEFPGKSKEQKQAYLIKVKKWLRNQGLSEKSMTRLTWIGDASWQSWESFEEANPGSSEGQNRNFGPASFGVSAEGNRLSIQVWPNVIQKY